MKQLSRRQFLKGAAGASILGFWLQVVDMDMPGTLSRA